MPLHLKLKEAVRHLVRVGTHMDREWVVVEVAPTPVVAEVAPTLVLLILAVPPTLEGHMVPMDMLLQEVPIQEPPTLEEVAPTLAIPTTVPPTPVGLPSKLLSWWTWMQWRRRQLSWVYVILVRSQAQRGLQRPWVRPAALHCAPRGLSSVLVWKAEAVYRKQRVHRDSSTSLVSLSFR